MRMKCKLLVLLALVVLTGCINQAPAEEVANTNTINEITYDGCVYLVAQNSAIWANNYSFTMTHKGNCPNAVHSKY